MKTIVCGTLDEFRPMHDLWDILWEASEVCNPSARSGSLISAVEQFYDPQEFLAVILVDKVRAVAAIPLVKRKVKKLFSVYAIPNNEWGRWGELMVHPDYEGPEIYSMLAKALENATALGVQLDTIDPSTRRWSQFITAMKNRKRQACQSFAFRVGIIEHDRNWNSFLSSRSRGFQKKLRKYNRGLSALGNVTFEHLCCFDDRRLEQQVAAAFAVENRGWKSQQGGSVIASRKLDFYLQQARVLARDGHLRISFLRLDGEIIAVEFGSLAKGTYNSWKIGYDPTYARFAPGQLLTEFVTRSFHQRGDCSVQDTVGPLSHSTEKWITNQSSNFNVLISGKSIVARIEFGLQQVAKTIRRQLDFSDDLRAVLKWAFGGGACCSTQVSQAENT